MAYTPARKDSYSIPVQPSVLSVVVTRGGSDTNFPVKVPWRHCRLTYAYAITTTVVATTDMVVSINLDSATGTTMQTITVPNTSSAVGDVTEGVVGTADAARRLDRNSSERDVVHIVVTGDGNAGAACVFLYFERE